MSDLDRLADIVVTTGWTVALWALALLLAGKTGNPVCQRRDGRRTGDDNAP